MFRLSDEHQSTVDMVRKVVERDSRGLPGISSLRRILYY